MGKIMPERYVGFKKGNYYHVFNRGVDKGLIFYNPGNYEYCLRLVKKYSVQNQIKLIAYCLMPYHYHFCLRQDSEISISKFINVLFNTYVYALNNQQHRKGTLFEGRFRHKLIDQEEYLLYLCCYIHQNPIKAKLVDNLNQWPYSNYPDWIGLRQDSLIDNDFVRNYFHSPEDYIQFMSNFEDEINTSSMIKKYIWD